MPRTHSSNTKNKPMPIIRPTATHRLLPPASPMVVPAASSSFGQTLKEGFAFGVGSSVARNIVDRWIGPPTSVGSVASAAFPAPAAPSNPVRPQNPPFSPISVPSPAITSCDKELQALNACLFSDRGEGVCADVIRAYRECSIQHS